MTKKSVIKPLSVALGTVFTVTLAHSTITNADENPFSMQPISGGHMILADGKCGASKGGKGMDGAGMTKGGEGKCGAGMGKGGMGKGGEGMCGMDRMDANGDGKITREEFMKGHESKFDMIDKNGDGVIDAAEHEAHMQKMMGFMKEGKCGGNK